MIKLCMAESRVGFDFQTGTDGILSEGWQSKSWYNSVDRASIRYELNTLLPYETLWIGAEALYSRHRGHSRRIPGHDACFIDYGLNLTVRYQPFESWPYIGALAGASYWTNRDLDVGDLGNSHLLGSWGAMIGKDWGIFDTSWSIRTEIRATHTSSGEGFGKNYGSAVVGVSYQF